MNSIIIVGDWEWPWYQEASARALEQLGCTVHRFGWRDQFNAGPGSKMRASWLRAQRRVGAGPVIWKIRRQLLELVQRERPDCVFFYNVQIIDAGTVRALCLVSPSTLFCQYANDDPFSPRRVPGLWRHFLASLPLFDVHFAYRERNIAEFAAHGARNVHVLRSYFIPEDDHPVTVPPSDLRFTSDVVFAGHYEDDGRLEMLNAVAAAGHRIGLFGTGWDVPLAQLPEGSRLKREAPVRPVFGEEYRRAICGAKAALCFLSRRNRDTYTRRNFQIPAMRAAMVTQASDELKSLFAEDREALFFSSPRQLVEQVAALVSDAARRERIAAAGYARVYRDGHDVGKRMEYFLATAAPYRAQKLEQLAMAH